MAHRGSGGGGGGGVGRDELGADEPHLLLYRPPLQNPGHRRRVHVPRHPAHPVRPTVLPGALVRRAAGHLHADRRAAGTRSEGDGAAELAGALERVGGGEARGGGQRWDRRAILRGLEGDESLPNMSRLQCTDQPRPGDVAEHARIHIYQK